MKKGTCEWRIHVGAHKTATTHLQDVMEICGPELLQQGINFIPRDIIRSRIRKIMPKDSWRFIPRNWVRKQMIEHRLAPQHRNMKTIIFSEEVILGNKPADLLLETPYPDIHKRLHFVRHLSRKGTVKLFLSIRSFDRVLPGAYTTELANNKSAPIILQKFLTTLDKKPPSWVDIIERIMAASPDAPIRVWKQEDYSFSKQTILSEFAGVTIEQIPDIPPPSSTITPSISAIRNIEALLDTDYKWKRQDWANRTCEIYSAKPTTNDTDRYTFLTPLQIDRLKQHYEEDLETISRRWPGILINT